MLGPYNIKFHSVILWTQARDFTMCYETDCDLATLSVM
jgi:hypothetical protein